MALRTVTYDPELWEIVPREPSIAMFRALTPWCKAMMARSETARFPTR